MNLDALTDDTAAEIERYTGGAAVAAEDTEALAHHLITWLRDRHALRGDPTPPLLFVLSDAVDPMPPTYCESLTDAKILARTRTAKRRRVALPTGDAWTVFTNGTEIHHRWLHVHEGRVVADYLIEEVPIARA